MKTEDHKMHWAGFNRFEIQLPEDCVTDCSHQGRCDEDIEFWRGKIDLSHISDDSLAAELQEYGAWDLEELEVWEAIEARIIWIAAGNIREEQNL
jgi:hypothetical protein